jgi:hypothetical protein
VQRAVSAFPEALGEGHGELTLAVECRDCVPQFLDLCDPQGPAAQARDQSLDLGIAPGGLERFQELAHVHGVPQGDPCQGVIRLGLQQALGQVEAEYRGLRHLLGEALQTTALAPQHHARHHGSHHEEAEGREKADQTLEKEQNYTH